MSCPRGAVVRGGLALALALAASSCIPSASRANARVEPGVNLGAVFGAQLFLPAEEGSGGGTDTKYGAHVELDAQWARRVGQSSAFAAQLKIPSAFLLASLDLYYQLPAQDRLYLGLGAELGAMPGAYAAATYYLGDDMFVTLTPRLLRELASENDDGSWQMSSQLAIGFARPGLEVAGVMQYAHQTGEGFNVRFELFTDERDYRTDFMLVGISVRK